MRELRGSTWFSAKSVAAVLVAVLVLAVIYTAGMMMWSDPQVDRTSTGTVQTEPSRNPPTVSAPPLTNSQQVAPDQVAPRPNPQTNAPGGNGG
ncbi:MAG: hypothetical protein IOC49_12720, partial [Methylobacterium sp.]|nr:hypothetical protein [Methylobacterium sp.]